MKTLAEAQTISEAHKELLLDIKRAIRRLLPSATVLLYGSFARGTQGPESDYDILVLTDAALDKDLERAIDCAIFDLELSGNIVISCICRTLQRWNAPLVRLSPFRIQIEREAIIL